jgi:hypothetical protein
MITVTDYGTQHKVYGMNIYQYGIYDSESK